MTDRAEPQVRVGPGFEQAWTGSSATATECVLNLFRLVDVLDAPVQRLARQHGIPSVAALNVLAVLRGTGTSMPPSAIADQLVVTRGNITGILRSLEQRGLVRRHVSPQDRRVIPVEITRDGSRRVDALQSVLHRCDSLLVSALPADHQRQLLAMLATLQQAVPHSYPQAAPPAPAGQQAAADPA